MLAKIEQLLWGWPLLLLIFFCGLYLTVRLRGLPLRQLPRALRLIFKKTEGSGISPFAALCTSLSATIGTGAEVFFRDQTLDGLRHQIGAFEWLDGLTGRHG